MKNKIKKIIKTISKVKRVLSLRLIITIGVIILLFAGIYFAYIQLKSYQVKQAEKERQELEQADKDKKIGELKKQIETLEQEPPKVVYKEVPIQEEQQQEEGEQNQGQEQTQEDTKDHSDNDGDHLENWFEDLIGTDKNKLDTDGDGVPDNLDDHPLDNSSIINKIYQVKDDGTGLIFPIRVNIPLDAYIMYKNKLSHNFEANASNIAGYALYGERLIQTIVWQVFEIAFEYEDANWYQIFRNLVAQIVYNSDKFTGYDEYPKYPIETIVDGSGDCEDTSILLATLLRGFVWRWQTALKDSTSPGVAHRFDGVNVGFIVMTGHVAVGYWVPDFEQLNDDRYRILHLAYYVHDNKKYCYIETTSNDFAPCEVPQQVDDVSKNVYIRPLE